MEQLSLLMWVTQFGFSVMFPLCACLLLANWLRQEYGLGMWIVAVLGVLGLLSSIRTAVSCVQSLLKQINRKKDPNRPDVPAFNQHQ